MPKPKPSSSGGCRKMMRRSFLFLLGVAAAKVSADYLSIEQNRSTFIKIVGQLWQKAIAKLDSSQSNASNKPLPNAPLPQADVTSEQKQTASLPQESVTPEPLTSPQSPQLTTTATPKRVAPVQVERKTVAGVSFYRKAP
jgi:hypothetical protein